MKIQQIYTLLVAVYTAQVLAKQSSSSNDEAVNYDAKVSSKLDTKSIDLDFKKDEVISDSKFAKYAEKDHPKAKSGTVTEIKPVGAIAKTGSNKNIDATVEDAPAYLKEESVTSSSSGESSGNSAVKQQDQNDPEAGQFHSFVMATSMIIVSEIGDKTFLIAALMAMKSPRLVVFSAAASALVIMTILSGIVGHALPALIPQRVTQFLASALFIIFGYKLLREGLQMSNEVGVNDEVAEVEEEIAMSALNDKNDDIEAGEGLTGGSSHHNQAQTGYKKYLAQIKELVGFVLSPTWVQVFVLTFLGEWGDRSQIATIAMAAGSDYWAVILGGCVGHTLCTAVAVLGGMFLASKISMKQVTLGGAATFFIFSILYLYEAVYGEH